MCSQSQILNTEEISKEMNMVMTGGKILSVNGMQVLVFHGNEPEIQGQIAEWAKSLAQQIFEGVTVRNEPVLIQSADKLLRQMERGLRVIVTAAAKPNELIAFITTYDLGTDPRGLRWWEMGTGWVPLEWRNKGLGNLLYEELYKLHITDVIVGTTKNPVALQGSVHAGFEVTSYELIPSEIREGLCYTTSCFEDVDRNRQRCKAEQNLGGCCFARVRWSLES